MSYLLLPDDERELVGYLVNVRGMHLLLNDVLDGDWRGGRAPHLATNALEAIPRQLPGPPRQGGADVYALHFWPEDAGKLVSLGAPGRAQDATSRVGLVLSQQRAGRRWRDVIDPDRSPLIRWRRCYWRENGHLTPGLLQGMAEITRLWPPELLRTHQSVERWLRKGSERVDPFEHCDDPPVVPPNRTRFVVWAMPQAADWVRRGGRVWPWTA